MRIKTIHVFLHTDNYSVAGAHVMENLQTFIYLRSRRTSEQYYVRNLALGSTQNKYNLL